MEALNFWQNMSPLAITGVVIGSMLFLFLARTPIHKAFESLSEGTGGGFRRIGDWAKKLAEKMRERDRKVLLESGIAAAENKLREEFLRVEASYSKHLADFPGLQRKLDDNISKIEGDYRECGQATPEAPGWNDAVASIAKIKGSSGDRIIEKMLGEIHKSAIEGEKRALSELRTTTAKRHKILSSMAPMWKGISKTLKEVGEQVSAVLETTRRIDKYMTQFEKVRKGDEDSIDMLASRANKLFIFSLIMISIAAAGVFVNFNIIALPVSELVPGDTRILGLPVSKFSAMVIICLEVMCGIFLTEALGMTNIIPHIGMMTRGKRRMILFASLIFLFLLACVEASLGVLREALAEGDALQKQALAGVAATGLSSSTSKFTVVGQAGLGFILPWILSMVAIPLEMLIETSQHVFYKFLILLVNLFGYLCNAIGYLIEYAIKILIHLYDAYIIVPSQIGNAVGGGKSKARMT
ncbi:MAG TPA: hypothetical protein VFX02_12275 [Gammaproteobacteria bacterium]|nr:hypothetical protein [Gammaproteobacteria bacterium]